VPAYQYRYALLGNCGQPQLCDGIDYHALFARQQTLRDKLKHIVLHDFILYSFIQYFILLL